MARAIGVTAAPGQGYPELKRACFTRLGEMERSGQSP
jgi:hypothetical protein